MNIYYTEMGNASGESILFIHGAGLPGWSWKKQIEYFQNKYHCIVVDLPDHGKSINTPFTSIEEISEELISIIKKIAHNGKAILIGHSLGAKIVTIMLSIDASVVTKAVIASALFDKSSLVDIMNNTAKINWSLGLYKKYPSLKKLQVKSFHFNDLEMEEKLLEEYSSLTSDAYQRYMMAFTETMILPEKLKEIANVDVLIVFGSKELKAMKKSAQNIHGMILNSEVVELKNCNHIYPINNPELFNQIVEDWLIRKEQPSTL